MIKFQFEYQILQLSQNKHIYYCDSSLFLYNHICCKYSSDLKKGYY